MISIFKDIIIFGLFNFYLEIFAPMLLLMRKVEKRKYFALRIIAMLLIGVSCYFLPRIKLGPLSVHYIIISVLLAVQILICYKTSVFSAVFFSLAAFSVQNIAWNVLMIFYDVIGLQNFTQFTGILAYIVVYAVIYTASVFFFEPLKTTDELGRNKIRILIISAIIILLACSVNTLLNGDSNNYGRMYAILTCLFALCTQFGIFRGSTLQSENKKLEEDKTVLQEILKLNKKHHELSKDTVEIIERKCHDLKHQISALRTMSDEEREKSLDEIENAVMIYGKIAKTTNPVLNAVLTEKGLLCEKYNIKFTYMLDGDSFAFMDSVDLSILFGNALDNAIESVVKEEDEKKRVIKCHSSIKDGFLGVYIENYCKDEVLFENGNPVTSKLNGEKRHGFGVKSIRYIVEKYGGSAYIDYANNLFKLKILFNLPD